MRREAELEWIRRFLEHLRQGTTELAPAALRLPSSIYTSIRAKNISQGSDAGSSAAIQSSPACRRICPSRAASSRSTWRTCL